MSKISKYKRRKRSSISAFGIIVFLAILLYVYKDIRPDFMFPAWKDYEVYGIDVSRYQLDIDWAQIANHEVSFAFIKATEGRSLVDRKFHTNWRNARYHDVPRGAYHFYRPHINWKEQYELFIKTVDIERGDLPPVLDIEVVNSTKSHYMVADIKKWLQAIEQHYGVRPIVYTYINFYNSYLLNDFRSYNLWIAKYSSSEPILKDNGRWEFWQYTDKGKIVGVEGDVDLNCFYGTKDQFKKLLKK